MNQVEGKKNKFLTSSIIYYYIFIKNFRLGNILGGKFKIYTHKYDFSTSMKLLLERILN
jgi:hypothetical protein